MIVQFKMNSILITPTGKTKKRIKIRKGGLNINGILVNSDRVSTLTPAISAKKLLIQFKGAFLPLISAIKRNLKG